MYYTYCFSVFLVFPHFSEVVEEGSGKLVFTALRKKKIEFHFTLSLSFISASSLNSFGVAASGASFIQVNFFILFVFPKLMSSFVSLYLAFFPFSAFGTVATIS